ncbi:GyrI-like domain-containing protein [Virgibacillus ndiopensis]|uniref:GyrI-like domain-containing protein n=1 Tax=Virgibacillus ndiopensis TaxID=2004408 RepID=UPI000C069731|nr:effector binding domain-containing protein [Virgibacillus ndiopensis]
MAVEQTNEAKVMSKKAFHAVGLKWEGTFVEAGAGGIRKIQEQMHKRIEEVSNVLNPETLLGLSYHTQPNGKGFTHYAVVEVESVESIPEGMISISVPTLTYATCEHKTGQSIEQSYNNIYTWIEKEGLKENNVDDLTHFEKYPMSQDPYNKDPEFTIMIPVIK